MKLFLGVEFYASLSEAIALREAFEYVSFCPERKSGNPNSYVIQAPER
jgi:hypothetical protein